MTYKTFAESFADYTNMGAVAGVGVIWRAQTKGSDLVERLAFARVGGVEYGTPLLDFPTGIAGGPPSADAAEGYMRVTPNPAVGATTVHLIVPAAGPVRVAVYDVIGRELVVIHEGPLPAREHELALDVSALPQGVYVVRASSGAWGRVRRLVVAR